MKQKWRESCNASEIRWKSWLRKLETQTSTLQNIQDDLLLRFDDNGSDANAEITESFDGNMLDVESTLDRALAQRAESGDTANNDSSVLRPDPGPQSSVVDSLTQAFTPQKATSPPIEGQIAELINNMLVGGLSAEMVKDRVEKHPPPENCENLSVTTVNEEVWDLLPRKSRSVDLAFQAVQATMLTRNSCFNQFGWQSSDKHHKWRHAKYT